MSFVRPPGRITGNRVKLPVGSAPPRSARHPTPLTGLTTNVRSAPVRASFVVSAVRCVRHALVRVSIVRLNRAHERPLADLDASNSVVSAVVHVTHSRVPDYIIRGGATYRLVSDERGSVRSVVNAATGAIAQRLSYDAFGRVLEDTAPGFQPFAFGGSLWDGETFLAHLIAREYDPQLGRFLTPDPALFEGGINLDGYCLSPIR